jgi:hypothetical protein
MTAQQLHDGLRQAYRWFYQGGRRWRRFKRHALHRDPRFNLAFAYANWNYRVHYHNPTVSRTPEFEAAAEEVAKLALTSAAPAQEALNVAFSQVASNVQFLPRKPSAAAAN